MSRQVLIGINVVLISVSVLLRRVLLFRDKSDPIAYAVVFQGLIGFMVGTYALLRGWHWPDFEKYWLAILVTTVLYALGNVTSAKAFQRVEASVMSVLMATGALWIIAASLFIFQDKLTLSAAGGAILVLASVLLLMEHKRSLKLDAGTVYGLLTAMLFGLAITTSAYVVRGANTDVPSWTALTFLLPSLLVLAIRPSAVQHMKPLLSGKVLIRLLVLCVMCSIASLASLLAYRDGNVNVIAVLHQTEIVLTTVLGIIFLREHRQVWKKLAAAALCFSGVLILI